MVSSWVSFPDSGLILAGQSLTKLRKNAVQVLKAFGFGPKGRS